MEIKVIVSIKKKKKPKCHYPPTARKAELSLFKKAPSHLLVDQLVVWLLIHLLCSPSGSFEKTPNILSEIRTAFWA